MIKINLRKIRRTRFLFECLLTAWLCIFCATFCEGKSTTTSQAPSITVPVHSSPTHSSPTPQNVLCVIAVIVVVLLVLGFFIWVFLKVCAALKNLGSRLNPQPPGSTNNPSIFIHGNDVATVTVTNFPVNGSSVAGATNAFANLFANAFGITNGTQQLVPPYDLGLWTFTGTNQDTINGNLIDYSGGSLVNFSVLTSDNLTNWQTWCTVCEWITTNANPWVCQALYTNAVTPNGSGGFVTNGALFSENWFHAQLDSLGTLTNIVAYGAFKQLPLSGDVKFFRFYCNTNQTADLTIGP